MNGTTVADQIIQVINALCEKFGIAFNWTADNLWPFVEKVGAKIVMYKIIACCIGLLIGIVLTIVALIFLRKALKYYNVCYKRDEFDDNRSYSHLKCVMAGFWVVFGTLAIAALILIFTNIFGLMQAIVVPERVVYDYIAGMLTGA
jgi:uncharacterized BrkB/YihY/UPF0761 family membrane protein